MDMACTWYMLGICMLDCCWLQAVIDSYAANFAQLGFGVGGRPGTAAAMTHRFLNGIEAAAAVDCHYSNPNPSPSPSPSPHL